MGVNGVGVAAAPNSQVKEFNDSFKFAGYPAEISKPVAADG